MVETVKFKVQRAITLKTGKPKLHFMCSAHRLMVLYTAGGFVKISQTVSELWRDTKLQSVDGQMDSLDGIT